MPLNATQLSINYSFLWVAIRWDMNFDRILVCFFLQDFPTYCITLTLLVLCVDRHQSIRHPELGPLPMRWILCLVWAISLALVLPYMAYITHVDLSVSSPQCILSANAQTMSVPIIHTADTMHNVCVTMLHHS